jgi:YgiT-type zinc finger domain-containing protein
MVESGEKETYSMICSNGKCPGSYEARLIAHTVRYQGKLLVVDHVPADVCPVCGDTLLSPETVQTIERMLANLRAPDATVPLYEFAGRVA